MMILRHPLCLMLSAILALLSGGTVLAAEATTYAQVWRVQGQVEARMPDGRKRLLRAGDAIRTGESIRTPVDGEIVLRTGDQGYLALRPNSEFFVEHYATNAGRDSRQTLSLLRGALRILTGWVAYLRPETHRLRTPTATIGVRGTDHEAYVLATDSGRPELPGTYDKVNRGVTLLSAANAELPVAAGRTAFARDPASVDVQSRALLTLLMPVLLARTPDFFIPGRFDAELDALTGAVSLPASEARPETVVTTTVAPLPEGCEPSVVGPAWLAILDNALLRRDGETLRTLFASDAEIIVNLRREGGLDAERRFDRDTLIASSLQAMATLRDYRQERWNIQANAAPGPHCGRIVVRSEVSEQGQLDDRPYRFTADEEFILERRAGKWLAVGARSRQR